MMPPMPVVIPQLSVREIEILGSISQFYTQSEIAEMLNISMHTVRTHTSHIRTKFGVGDIRHAVRRAREVGLL